MLNTKLDQIQKRMREVRSLVVRCEAIKGDRESSITVSAMPTVVLHIGDTEEQQVLDRDSVYVIVRRAKAIGGGEVVVDVLSLDQGKMVWGKEDAMWPLTDLEDFLKESHKEARQTFLKERNRAAAIARLVGTMKGYGYEVDTQFYEWMHEHGTYIAWRNKMPEFVNHFDLYGSQETAYRLITAYRRTNDNKLTTISGEGSGVA